ncbi:hypothetical protein CTheo_8227 [Ceratobasidium theobromae]|uniref:Cyanovirin-N domain-containing protein n=1 Tax=Ceratobasidium theobromae TaxID=1582974 RepID=A0A5N5Q989_9AGAM|nr:hypothetical protein CTheo_8227 [Ceratobasidium theobromae]
MVTLIFLQPPSVPSNHVLKSQESPTSGRCVVEVKSEPNSSLRWNPTLPSDPQFNLSAMLGNNDGLFIWGRSGFEQTGRNFKLEEEENTRACLLTGELIDLHGVYKPASINLDEHLKVESYVDHGTNETYHRLTERHQTSPEASDYFSKNTNVVKLMELLKKDDAGKQMTGVGTYSPPGVTTQAGLAVASKVDEGVAWYLYQHVIDGYKFLMQTYRVGDRIALFGFSRGAFTARALAGMLHCVGLLPRHNLEHVPFAYEVYKNAYDGSDTSATTTTSTAESMKPKDVDPEDFKRTFCIPIIIDFVGVWLAVYGDYISTFYLPNPTFVYRDTVASVGALVPRTLPWIDYNPSITTFRQALALDERRGNFSPSVWDHRRTTMVQDVREVWFRGEHSDIGGGSAGPVTDKDGSTSYTMLSNITLRWMIRQTLECKTGILFDHIAIERYRARNILETPPKEGLQPSKDWMKRLAQSVALDRVDVQNKIYDSIGWSPLWNGMEYLAFTAKPTKNDKFEPTTTRWPNAKNGRSIFSATEMDPIFIHSSVVDYLTSLGPTVTKKDYKPRATWFGYGAESWPRIEDTSTFMGGSAKNSESNPALPDDAKLRLDVDRPVQETGLKRWLPF